MSTIISLTFDLFFALTVTIASLNEQYLLLWQPLTVLLYYNVLSVFEICSLTNKIVVAVDHPHRDVC